MLQSMVKLSDLTHTTDDGNIGLPLPLGPTIKGTTMVNKPVVAFTASEFNTHASTSKGWPKIITGTGLDNKKFAMGLYYPGDINDKIPEQEIDLVVYSDQTALGIVALPNKSKALDRYNYEIKKYTGYQEVYRSDWNNMSLENKKDYFERGVTPVIYAEDSPYSGAVVLQRGETISDIANLFRLYFNEEMKERKKDMLDKIHEKESSSDHNSSLDKIADKYINDSDEKCDRNKE